MRNRSPKGAGKKDGHSADHYTRLAEDFGFARSGYRAIDEGRPMSRIRFLLQPLSLLIISLIALVIVSGLQLWRHGVFDPIFGPKSATVAKGPKRWMLNGRATRVGDDRVVEIDEPDIDRGPPPPPEGDVVPVQEPKQ
jgi:hypothetical protein